MTKYIIDFNEELVRRYEIEADSEDQAIEKATDAFNSGDMGEVISENLEVYPQ